MKSLLSTPLYSPIKLILIHVVVGLFSWSFNNSQNVMVAVEINEAMISGRIQHIIGLGQRTEYDTAGLQAFPVENFLMYDLQFHTLGKEFSII